MKLETIWIVIINLGVIAVLSMSMYLGWRELHAYKISRMLLSRGKPNAGMRRANQGKGFNPANIYFTMNYDCRKEDIQITGVMPETLYWSMTVYDRYTVPLKSFLVDDSLVRQRDDRYSAWLTRRPLGRPNEIDVSTSPRGLLIIRNSLPRDPHEVANSPPKVRTVQCETPVFQRARP